MTTQNVSATVVSVLDSSSADEQADGSLDRTVQETVSALLRYDSDGQVPTKTATSLEDAARLTLEIADETAGPDIVALVVTGDTREVNTDAVWYTFMRLDKETIVVLVVHSNQTSDIDRDFLDRLDNVHPKAGQIDVVYTTDEKIADVIGREVEPFLAQVA
jgi:hypothetical protein